MGGGVELTLQTVTQELARRGHQICVLGPVGSHIDGVPVVEVPGALQTTAQTQSRDLPVVMPHRSVLAAMWDYARQVQDQYDVLFNIAYDWLPFYLTPFLQTPVAHFVSMGSLLDVVDDAVVQTLERYPGTVGMYTATQAETFGLGDRCRCLGSGVDLSRYTFGDRPEDWLVWLGRLSPEKGLEDAVAAAQSSGVPLKIFGKLEDAAYWEQIQRDYPEAPVEYGGFLTTTEQLQSVVRRSRGLVMTPRWVEAFGNVAIEALACGVPVIAYRRGGPSEIVRDGKTGWLVEPDSVEGLVQAIARLDEIDRRACRQQAEAEYSLTALGDRFEAWFQDLVTRYGV